MSEIVITTTTNPVQPVAAQQRRHRSPVARDGAHAAVYLVPWALGVLWLVVAPVGLAVYWSFTRYNLLTPPHWIGLGNYRSLLHDAVFLDSVRNTLYLTVIGVSAGIVMGLGSAVLLNGNRRSNKVFRSAIFLPAIVPPVATAICWLFLLNPQYGLINQVLRVVGVEPIGWLNDPHFAKLGLLMMVLWGSVGQIMMTFSAALQEIPSDLFEAASMEGAGTVQAFRWVTLPLLAPIILYNVVIATLFYFQFFEQAFVVSPTDLGAPTDSTMTYSLYIYQQAFTYLHMGVAAAMSCLLLVVSAAVIAIFFAINRRFSES
jgi:multiple sugar transport system permease protein